MSNEDVARNLSGLLYGTLELWPGPRAAKSGQLAQAYARLNLVQTFANKIYCNSDARDTAAWVPSPYID